MVGMDVSPSDQPHASGDGADHALDESFDIAAKALASRIAGARSVVNNSFADCAKTCNFCRWFLHNRRGLASAKAYVRKRN
jgi:hypothetical protein